MVELVESKPASSSSPSSSPSFRGLPKAAAPSKPLSPFSKANVAAMEANELGISQRRPQQQQPRFSPTPQQPRASSSTPQQPRASSSTPQQHQWVPSSIQWAQQSQQL